MICIAFVLSPLPILAQSHRFDMGPAGSPLAAGFQAVDPDTLYSAAQGFGWLTPPTASISRSGASSQFALDEANFPAALIEDATASGVMDLDGQPAPFSFQLDAAPGRYWCFAYLGDLGDPSQEILTPLEGMSIRVNGVTRVEEAFAQLLLDKASHWKARGGYKRVAFLVNTNAQSQLLFEFESAVDNPLSLMGLEILPFSEPPVAFERSQQRLVVGSAYTGISELVQGVASMNQHDYASARAHFDAVANPIARAWGHAWWLGWLTAEEEAVDEALLQQTRELLEAEAVLAPDDAAVIGLLYELRDFQWGELFLRTRAYTNFPNPKSLGNLLVNLCASAQFLEQMSGDLLSDAAVAHETQSPFFAKAQYLLARNLYGRNTHFSKEKIITGGEIVSFEKFGLYTLAIFDALWPRLDPSASFSDRIFPQAYEALMLTYRIQQGHPPPGQWYPLGEWDGSVPAITQQELENTWWFREGYTNISAPSGASAAWADYQRHYAELLRSAGHWWIQEREIDGQLGGGTGDDVEAGALELGRLSVAEGFTDFVESGFKRVFDAVIEADDFVESQGYVVPVTDSAHGGEHASFPLLFFLSMRYGDARYLNQAMHNVRNMDEFSTFPGEGTIWTGTPDWVPSQTPDRLLFRAFWFSFDELTTNVNREDDIPINYRAILGGFPLMDYNGSPRTREIFEDHARAWADAAMSTAPGHAFPKPAGVIPVSVEYATGLFGEPDIGGLYEWWKHSQKNSGSLGGYNDVVYAALYDAYLRSDAADRKELIRPLHEAVNFVAANPPDENAAAPDNAWVSQKIHKAVTKVALRARLALEAEWGTSPAMIDNLVGLYANEYAKYLDLPSGQPGGKPKDGIEATWKDAATWLEYFFPLATVTVSYTDRIKLFPKQPQGIQALHGLYAMRSGAPAFEVVSTSLITWLNTAPGEGPLDVALLVNDYTPSGDLGGGQLKILAHNYAATPKQLRMKLWRVLTPGNYRITQGPDTNFDDQGDGPGSVLLHDFDHKGDFVDLTLPPDTPTVIDLVQLSAIGDPAPQLDLGLSEDLFRLEDDRYVATVSNLGSLDYPGGAATLELVAESTSESVTIPALLAPGVPGSTGLDAQTWTHRFSLVPAPQETLDLRILHTGEEITEENNHVTKTFNAPEPGQIPALAAGLAVLWALTRRRRGRF